MAWCGIFFSVQQDGDNNHLFPSFRQLPRHGELKGKCRISLKDTKAQTWVQKIWDGECVYHVIPSGLDEGRDLCFDLYVTTTDDETLAQCEANDELIWVNFIPDLEDMLDSHDQELLKARMMHHFLRQFIYTVPTHHWKHLLTGQLVLVLTTSKKYKEELLDWRILQADLALNLPPTSVSVDDPDEFACIIYRSLSEVGCTLAALKRWEDAAPFYLELGDAFLCDMWSYAQAARSYYHVGNDEKALETYVKALARLGANHPNPDVNQYPYSQFLCAMLWVHHAIFEAYLARKDQTGSVVTNKRTKCAIAFVALLRRCNLKDLEKYNLEEYFGTTQASCLALLKDKVRTPNLAKRALLRALRSGSMDEYETNLLGVLRPNAPIKFRRGGTTELSDDMRQ